MELASFNLNPNSDFLREGNLLQQKIKDIKIGEIKPVQNVKDSELPEYEKAARGFEGIFLNMLYKEMKSGLDKNAFSSNEEKQLYSFGDKTLGGYIDMLFTEQLSNTGNGMGIADLIYKQLTGRDLPYKSQQYAPLTEQVQASSINATTDEAVQTATSVEQLETKSTNTKGDSFWDALIDRIDGFKDAINKASDENGISKNLIKSVIATESAGKSNAVSGAGAKGLMQLMDGTASDLGVANPFDAEQNINGGSKYLSQMLEKFNGDTDLALAAYNAGPGNVEKYNGIPPFTETKEYVARVKNYLNKFEAMA